MPINSQEIKSAAGTILAVKDMAFDLLTRINKASGDGNEVKARKLLKIRNNLMEEIADALGSAEAAADDIP